MYAIYDTKAKVYNQPFHFHNDQMAIRACIDLRNDKNTEPGRHPEDFTLHHLGEYEDTTATIKSEKNARCVCRFIELPDKDQILQDHLDDELTKSVEDELREAQS